MAEARQIPVDEYESMKKSYGFNDEQMKSIIGIEPIKTRWADGYGESRKKDEDSEKLRRQQLVEEIKSKLKNTQSSPQPVEKETVIEESKEEIKVSNETAPQPSYAPTNTPEPAPSFEMPTVNKETTDTQPTNNDVPMFDVPEFSVPEFSLPDETQQNDSSEIGMTPKFEVEEDKPSEIDMTPKFEMKEEKTSEIDMTPKFEMKEEKTSEIDITPKFEMKEDKPSEIDMTPKFEMKEDKPSEIDMTPKFEMEESELSQTQTQSRDEMFNTGKKRLLEMINSEKISIEVSDFTR